MTSLLKRINDGDILICDGAMGTLLQAQTSLAAVAEQPQPISPQ